MGIYDEVPPIDGGYTIGISYNGLSGNGSYGQSLFSNNTNIKPSNPVYLDNYNPTQVYQNKKNSNIQYKQFKPKIKGVARFVSPNHSYPFDDRYHPSQTPAYHMNHYRHYINALNDTVPINYDIQDDTNMNEYLPFYGKNPKMNESSKQFLKEIGLIIGDALVKMSWLTPQSFAAFYGNSGYISTAQWTEEIKENFRGLVLAVAQTAMKAGVPCEQIYNDLIEVFPQMTGLDKTTFVDACKQEKKEEVKRKKYGHAKPNPNCCLAMAYDPMGYLKENETYEDYSNRLGNSTYFSDFLNTEFSFDFF
uniref:hypothetical protein n=1 Tax=Aliarcobacter sp. TaxID=2321116 RepID=UPI004048821F